MVTNSDYLLINVIASFDFGLAIWDRYVRVDASDHPVSYVAHLAGAIAGLTLGLTVMKFINVDNNTNRRSCCLPMASTKWTCTFIVGLYCLLMTLAIGYIAVTTKSS